MEDTSRSRYQQRIEGAVYSGECAVCSAILRPKRTSEYKQEWFCHLCGGARHFCEDPECFFLLEVFYSKCEGGDHRKLLMILTEEDDPEADEEWLVADDDDGGVESSWRLHPNRPQFR